jgi:type I restriction enzyme R subunit
VKVVDFWDNYTKQKQLRSWLISNILLPRSSKNNVLYGKRNEIAQKLLELAYHIHGKN